MFLLAFSSLHYLFIVPLCILSVFLSLVILVQRGRGGGLTGALGGMGGQSAFGTKAGDLFTRITIVVAAIWIILSMAAVKVLNRPVIAKKDEPADAKAPAKGGTTTETPATEGDNSVPAANTPATKTPPADPVPPATDEKDAAAEPAAPADNPAEPAGSDKATKD